MCVRDTCYRICSQLTGCSLWLIVVFLVQGQAFSVAEAVEKFPYYLVQASLCVYIPAESVVTKLFVGPHTLEYLESAFECKAELPV